MEINPNTNTIFTPSEGVNIIIVNSKDPQSSNESTISFLKEEKFNEYTGSIQANLETLDNESKLFIKELPSNLISSSEQIAEFGFRTECVDLTPLNNFTESIQLEIVKLNDQTHSFLTSLPSDLISSSEQILNLGFITNNTDISALNNFTESIHSEINIINDRLESIKNEFPTTFISSSEQIAEFGFITKCVDLSSLNNFTGSILALMEHLATQITGIKIESTEFIKGPLTSNNIIDFNSKVINLINENTPNEGGNPIPTPTTPAINIGDNITAKTGSFDHLEVNNFTNNGTGVPTISSPTNLVLNASSAVVIDDLLQLKGTTIESVSNPLNGSIIYDNVQHKFFGYANGAWVAFN